MFCTIQQVRDPREPRAWTTPTMYTKIKVRIPLTNRVWLKKCPCLTLGTSLYLSYEDMAGPARTVTVT